MCKYLILNGWEEHSEFFNIYIYIPTQTAYVIGSHQRAFFSELHKSFKYN